MKNFFVVITVLYTIFVIYSFVSLVESGAFYNYQIVLIGGHFLTGYGVLYVLNKKVHELKK